MKYKPVLFVAALLLGLAAGCDKIYFTEPQPSDQKNIYTFPKNFRGAWRNGHDTIIIGKDYFKTTYYFDMALPKQVVDSSGKYIVANNKIFVIDSAESIKLSPGMPFTIKNDSFFIMNHEATIVQLGPNSFLRKAGDKYILNVKNKENWWEIFLLFKTKDGSIITRVFNAGDIDNIKGLNPIFTSGDDTYLDVKWTEAELLGIIENQGFSDTAYHLKPSQKFRYK